MTRCLLIVLTFFFITSACASHYYKVKNDELHIYLKKPDAEQIYFLCSLDQFEPRPALKVKSGTWETILPSGQEFRYFYLIDGNTFIPACEMKEKDDFGSENCIYIP